MSLTLDGCIIYEGKNRGCYTKWSNVVAQPRLLGVRQSMQSVFDAMTSAGLYCPNVYINDTHGVRLMWDNEGRFIYFYITSLQICYEMSSVELSEYKWAAVINPNVYASIGRWVKGESKPYAGNEPENTSTALVA